MIQINGKARIAMKSIKEMRTTKSTWSLVNKVTLSITPIELHKKLKETKVTKRSKRDERIKR